jgi:hypothetical protein
LDKNNIPESRRIRIEKKTIDSMIKIYCRDNHNSIEELCDDCKELQDYAFRRLIYCPYQEEKPVCSDCPIHCYNARMRLKVREIMRYSGPRMIFKHPYLAVMHLLREKFSKPQPA